MVLIKVNQEWIHKHIAHDVSVVIIKVLFQTTLEGKEMKMYRKRTITKKEWKITRLRAGNKRQRISLLLLWFSFTFYSFLQEKEGKDEYNFPTHTSTTSQPHFTPTDRTMGWFFHHFEQAAKNHTFLIWKPEDGISNFPSKEALL